MKRVTPEMIQRMRKLRDEGLNNRTISIRMGVSQTHVSRCLNGRQFDRRKEYKERRYRENLKHIKQ